MLHVVQSLLLKSSVILCDWGSDTKKFKLFQILIGFGLLSVFFFKREKK